LVLRIWVLKPRPVGGVLYLSNAKILGLESRNEIHLLGQIYDRRHREKIIGNK
jgi:hypothetical protein